MNNKIKKCVGKEGFQRMSYLYQAARNNILSTNKNKIASTFYTNLMINISKKTVQKLDINIKRTICKGCRSFLHPGTTARVRTKKKKLTWTCVRCNTKKSFDLRQRTHQPWTLRPESIVEILDYTKNEYNSKKTTIKSDVNLV